MADMVLRARCGHALFIYIRLLSCLKQYEMLVTKLANTIVIYLTMLNIT